MAVSFIGGGNRSTRAKSQTCHKPRTHLSHNVVSNKPHHEVFCRINYGNPYIRSHLMICCDSGLSEECMLDNFLPGSRIQIAEVIMLFARIFDL